MPRPSILLISSDQHNAEILGCMGNPVVCTPHIDRLAAEGTVFDSALTPLPLCTPARTSIFTGLTCKSHTVYHNINMGYKPGKPCLPPEFAAFPERLAEAGYDTAFFGKLHTRHECGRNFGLRTARLVEGKCHFVPSPDDQDEYRRYLADRGYPPDVWKVWENDPSYAVNNYATSPLPNADYIDTFIADMAIDYLRGVEAPFFAWGSFCTPHNPWDPPRAATTRCTTPPTSRCPTATPASSRPSTPAGSIGWPRPSPRSPRGPWTPTCRAALPTPAPASRRRRPVGCSRPTTARSPTSTRRSAASSAP